MANSLMPGKGKFNSLSAPKGAKVMPNKSMGAVGKVASGKPPKQTITPVKTDRGSFGIKGSD